MKGEKRFKLIIKEHVHYIDFLPEGKKWQVMVDGALAYKGELFSQKEVLSKLNKIKEKGYEISEVPFITPTEPSSTGRKRRRKRTH